MVLGQLGCRLDEHRGTTGIPPQCPQMAAQKQQLRDNTIYSYQLSREHLVSGIKNVTELATLPGRNFLIVRRQRNSLNKYFPSYFKVQFEQSENLQK